MKNLMLLLVSLAVSVLVFEAAFRWYEGRYLAPSAAGDEAVIDLAAFNYNDGEIARTAEPGSFRILSFGDSFGYTITKYPHSYHGVAARLLNQAADDVQVRIVNLGEPAISFYQYIKAYRTWGPQIEHDAVVFNVYLGNDILDNSYGFVPDDVPVNRIFSQHNINVQTGHAREVRVPRKFPLRMLDYAWAYFLTATGRIQRVTPTESPEEWPYNLAVSQLAEDVYYDTLRAQLDNLTPDLIPALEKGYRAAAAFAREVARIQASGVPVAVMLAPNEIQAEPARRRDLAQFYDMDLSGYDWELPGYFLETILARLAPDVPVINLIGTFQCAAEQGLDLYYQTDTHWSLAGNQLAGEQLARFIAETWLDGRIGTLDGLNPCVTEQPATGLPIAATERRRNLFETRVAPMLDLTPR